MSTTHLIVTAGLLAWIACAGGILVAFVRAPVLDDDDPTGWSDADRQQLRERLSAPWDEANDKLASLYPSVPDFVPCDWENETLHGLGDFDGGEAA